MPALRNMWSWFNSTRKTAALLFLGLFGFYLSLSPGSIGGQGYTGEEIDSGARMIAIGSALLKGLPRPPMLWTRHGPVPIMFDLPFIGLGQFLVSPDFMLSFQPPLLTAALVTILYLWLRKLCSPGMSLLLAFAGAFGTMLWPYAYIGLETKQSFFVLLAGYLALADRKLRSWPKLLLFAVICGLALTVKSTGIILWPAIAYLLYVQFRDDWRLRRTQVLAVVVVIGGVWALGAWGRNFYWKPLGGGANSLRSWTTHSALHVFSNAIGVFGSPTKGLFVYAPVLLAGIYAVPRAFRTHREIVIYSLLLIACTLGLISILRSPTDEVWGCRYMHVAIAPLLLCIGAAWPRFRWSREGALIPLILVGVVISFLGAFYYYGVLGIAMTNAGQNTYEWINGDNVWNHIEFNARLFRVWFHGGAAPVMWKPWHIWVWTPPADAPQWKSIDLRPLCLPQSFMVRNWTLQTNVPVLINVFRMYLTSLVVGLLSLAWVVLRTIRHPHVANVADLVAAGNEVQMTAGSQASGESNSPR